MNSVIYNPTEEFAGRLKDFHLENTNVFFDGLVEKSGVNVEENRETVKQYNLYKENLVKLKRKLIWWRILRVLAVITIFLIPLVIFKMTPKIRELRSEIELADSKAEELLAQAYSQMLPLNSLFTDRDGLKIIEKTIPLIAFDPCFTAKFEEDMKINFDFCEYNEGEQSTIDVLSGKYNENPFLFENKIVHTMGVETYHGYKEISWTETYRDSNGKLQRRTRHQTLHATVQKPKPFYNTQVVLNYGSQGAPELSFSRDATYLDQKSEKAIERYVKKGEKKLKKMTDKAMSRNEEFTSMSNSEFEVLFDALNRTNEVQFRTLFTPLAQTNMVELLLSKSGFGDDFNFVKANRMNRIVSKHSQGREINLKPEGYTSYSFDIIKNNFVSRNTDFFKAVYFDFAPILAIPAYQERPVHSLKPVPDFSRLYAQKECEALANAVDRKYVVHPATKTPAILKSAFVNSKDSVDETCITAYSYDIEQRVDIVQVRGGDGRVHNVSVPWDEYMPLLQENTFFITTLEKGKTNNVKASRNGLCIYN